MPGFLILALKDELTRRRISPKLANQYLKQGFILDTDTSRTYTGFLFQNDKNGYEISIPNPAKGTCFKTSAIAKACTTIEGTDESKADVFEGFWDFLSWLEMNKITTPRYLTFVLNSLHDYCLCIIVYIAVVLSFLLLYKRPYI